MTKSRDLTRDKLLLAAFEEIHRHGFQAASIAKILDETGLTKGALYHHFPTKQALGLAVVDEIICDELDQRIFGPIRTSDTPLQALLDVLKSMEAGAIAEFVELGCPLNNLMQEMSPLDHQFRDRLNAILSVWIETVESALRDGKRRGVIRADIDCGSAALFIVSAWEGCVGISKNLQSEAAMRSCFQQLREYIRGLASPGASI